MKFHAKLSVWVFMSLRVTLVILLFVQKNSQKDIFLTFMFNLLKLQVVKYTYPGSF